MSKQTLYVYSMIRRVMSLCVNIPSTFLCVTRTIALYFAFAFRAIRFNWLIANNASSLSKINAQTCLPRSLYTYISIVSQALFILFQEYICLASLPRIIAGAVADSQLNIFRGKQKFVCRTSKLSFSIRVWSLTHLRRETSQSCVGHNSSPRYAVAFYWNFSNNEPRHQSREN